MPSGVFPDSFSSSDVAIVDETDVSIIGIISKKIATKAER